FLALLLAAGAIASERDENAIGRLARGLVSMGEIVWAKVALAAVVALALGLVIALVFGAIVEAGNVVGGEPWARLPLLAVGLLLAGAALGAVGSLLGALARDARSASLVAVLVVMPVVFLGLVPREVSPAAAWISDALPFTHAVRYFASSLYVGPEAFANDDLPGLARHSLESVVAEAGELERLGVRAVILFGIPEEKDEEGSGAWDDDGIVQRALRALAGRDLVLLTDVCLC